MSTVTKAISSVEFHVNARQANAALQSIQEEAKRCREQVEELQEQAAKGVTTVKVDGMDVDIQKRIREVKALQKTWESAAQSQIKGAKAFDELWKNARMGTIESMTGAQIKSGINASKPIYDRLRLGDAEDRMKAQAIKDMQDQGQKVLNQLKTTTDQIIKQIADGETIAADVLEREARNLKSIMDLLPPLSQEWKDYNLQYQAINQQIERQAVLERQLRGEIVTREDAIRVINAANREATQQEIAQEEQRAKAAREAAEAKAAEADQYRTTVEQKQSEIFATNDLIAAKRREIDTHHESAAAAKDAADKARDAAYKDRKQAEQEARNQQEAYNKQKKIRDDAAKDVEKFRKELEKLGEVKAEPKITVDTSELEKQLANTKSRIQQLLEETRYNPTFYKGRDTVEKEIAYERGRIEEYRGRISEHGDINAKKAELLSLGQKKSGLKKAEFDFFQSEKDTLDYFAKIKSEAGSVKKEFESVSAEIKELKVHGFDFDGLLDSKSVAEFYQRLENLVHLFKQIGNGDTVNGGTKPLGFDKMQTWLEEQFATLSKLKDTYREAADKVHNQKKTSDTYWDIKEAEHQVRENESFIQSSEKRIASLEELNNKQKEEKQITEQLAAAQGDALKDLGKLQDEYNQKVERRKQLEQELANIQNSSFTDNPRYKELQAEINKLEELINVSEKYRKQFSKMSDSAFEKGYMGRDGMFDDERKNVSRAEEYLKRAYSDRLKSSVAGIIPKEQDDYTEYQEAAKRVAAGIVQNAQENFRRAMFTEIQNGELTSAGMREKVEHYRRMMEQATREAQGSPGGLRDDPEYNRFKFMIAQMEKYIEVAEQVEAERKKIAGSDPFIERAKTDVMNDKFGEGFTGQRANKIIEQVSVSSISQKQEDELIASEKVRKAKDEERIAEENLNKAKRESATATAASNEQDEKRAAVQQKLADAETRLADENRKLNEQADKTITANQQATQAANTHQQSVKALGDVMEENRKTGQRLGEEMGELTKQQKQQTEELADASEKMTDAEKESNRHIKTEQEARLRIQQLNNQSIEQLTASLRVLEEENRRINDPGNQQWQKNERYIGQLNLRLEELKKQSAELRREKLAEEAERIAKIVGGDMVNAVQSVTSRVEQATEATRFGIRTLDGQIDDVNREMSSLSQHMDEVGNRSTNLMPYVNSITESTKALQEQKAERQEYLNTFQEEAKERAKNIEEQKRQIALMEQERDAQLQTLDQRIKSQQENLEVLKTLHPQTETFSQMSASLEQEIQRLQEEKAALENSEEIKQKLAEANKRLADMIEADAKEIATSETVIAAFDQKIDEIQQSMEKLAHSVPGFDAEELMKYESELSSLTAELQKHQEEREQFIATFEKERAERAQAIEQQKQQIAAIEKEREASINSVNARLEAAQQALAQLRELPDELRGSLPVSDMIQTQLRTIRELQKERFAVATDAEQRLKQANDNLAASIKSDEEATAKAQATIQQYDAQIQKLETDIAQLTQKLSSAKSPLDAKDMEESAKKMGELQAQLKTLTDEREKYVALLQRQREEAQDLAEAERAQAVAEKEGMSIEKMEDALKVLEERRRTLAADSPEWEKNEQYISTLNSRLAEVKQKVAELSGEWMSLEKAMELASKAGTDGFAGSAKDIQLATQSLERQRDTIIATIREKRNLGQATKAEEDQLADLTKKLRSLKFEQDNVNMSQEKMRTLIETPANAVNLDELRAAIKRADGQLRQMQQSLGQNSDEYKRFAEQVRQAKNVMKEMEGQAKASATAWEKAFNRLKTYVVMYMGFNTAWQKVSATATDLMDLSDRMGEVGKTTQMTAEQIERLTLRLRDLDTRTSLVALTELSAKAGQLGLKTEEDVLGFTEAANKMLVALPEMGADGATQMMKVALATGEVDRIGKEMQQGLVEGSSATAVAMEKIASTIDQLRANSAAAAPQITDFVKRVGAVGAQSGITIDQVAALGSTVDALGMRVEMSATALSRMIPAIRRNAFEVAKAIGMAPNALRDMFDEAGGGMQAMLAIFQHIKDAGMNSDDIEKMLGMGGMQDIMKDLNQQGARAGIVFAGLSQNVDVLREHLGIAHQAYEDNVAIQQEYDRMNETTAARWERLKNQFEEMWVGPAANNMLGGVIDALRVIVDLISGPLNTAFNSTIIAVASIKTGLTGIPAAIGSAFDYMRNSAAQASTAVKTASKATQIINAAASVTESVSEATEEAEGAADIVGSVSDALSEAKEAGEQAGEAVEIVSGAIGKMGDATKTSIFSVKGLTAAWKGLDTTMKVNIFVAVASALWTIGKMIWDMVNEADAAAEKLAEELNKLDEEEEAAERSVRSLMNAYDLANKKAEEATRNQAKLEQQTEALRKDVDALKGSKDKSTASSDALTKKEEELKRAEELLKQATKESVKANGARLDLINEINSKYSTYLGYMLDEKTAAQQVALAHLQIVDALKEELEQKRLNKEQESIEEQASEGLGEARKSSQASLSTLPKDMQRRITSRWNEIRGRMVYAEDEEGRATYTLPAIEGLVARDVTKGSYKDLRPYLQRVFRNIVADEIREAEKNIDRDGNKIRINLGTHSVAAGSTTVGTKIYTNVENTLDDFVKQAFQQFDTWTERTIEREEKLTEVRKESESYTSGVRATSIQNADKANAKAYSIATETLGTISSNQQLSSEVVRKLAQQANVITANLKKFDGQLENADKYIGKGNEATLQNAVDTMYAKLSEQQRRQILNAAQKTSKISDESGGAGGGDNIWGNRLPAESTDWKNMTAEQLVNRRKQMADFVNAIQTDTDVKAVLEEDAALKKAIENGMSSDMRTVIEWYNTERLKIQDELHARHLTNTGDWLDPKKERGAKKQFRDEMDAYLHELDAYYTERKTRIEQARNDEEITEGEAWRRTIQNDNEWQTRRAELQKLYSRKQKEVTQEELDAIIRIIAERTGDSESFVKAAITKTNQFVDAIEKSGDKGAAIVHRWMSQVVLDTERSYLKAAQAIGKQMKFIEDTLAKERPYDGITKNLQDNLDKMGVLAAKYRRENEELARQGKEPKYSNEQITAQSFDEMAFYLRQAADAYSIDIDELLRRMVNEGMTATAEEISKSDMLKQAVMGQLRKTYQEVQDAVKKEASQIKKDVEIIWNDDARGIGGMSMKATFDKALAQLGMQQDSVSRANSLIGAGAASDNVASRLAMKQIEVQMRMQKAQYDMYRVQANQRMAALKAEAEEHRRLSKQMEKENHLAESKRELLMATNAERDAENVRLSLGLTLAEETKKQEQQKAELLKIQEESQNRLYTSLREWADLLTSSLQGVMEASHAGDAEYYNELAKLNLTGSGGPGAGTYVVIDDAGTSDAKAHYEYLDERQALERQHEIEVQNAQAEAWRKLMDDLNMKMSEQITDWLNAAAQNASVDANTDATLANTEAIVGLTAAMGGKVDTSLVSGLGYEPSGNEPNQTIECIGYESEQQVIQTATTESAPSVFLDPINVGLPWEQQAEAAELSAERQVGAIDKVKVALDDQFHKQEKGSKESSQKMTSSTQSAFAKMTAAANLYGIAYQAMSNDNLSAAQKFSMMAIQAAGQSAITALTVDFSKTTADAAMNSASVLGKLWSQLGWGAVPVYAIFTGLLGGLMGLAASKIAKSKSEIAQATGASVGAGRLATGMLTYAEGNVNELTDPASLTPGRQYNVDGTDGKTYRARYMGKGAKTHITNGPEFHLVGEAGREAIIDAKTTRLLQMNETGIWRDIQTLYNGGSISGMASRRRRGGVRAFAEGNIGEFEEMADGGGLTAEGTGGMEMEQMLTALDRNSAIQEALLERLNQPIYAQNILYGPDGLPNVINKLNKEAQRHGEKYL